MKLRVQHGWIPLHYTYEIVNHTVELTNQPLGSQDERLRETS